MRIRSEQINALSIAMVQGWEQRIIARLRVEYPEQLASIGAEEAVAIVGGGVARAATHGITAELDVERYISLLFSCSQSFDTSSWAKSVLEDDTIPPEYKVDQLEGLRDLLGSEACGGE
jgi:hypothetical protein